ncbi:hypothetical protein [Streptomyces sp. KLOTTS4A1]|uniref:hypothetical protein n=1 Tax=Streptomyces sp. KLOTTS4A1 TaxID=3390996 RepID=UPI0039F59025
MDEETRRPTSRLVVASVAAAVLLAGGGGAYLATSSSGGGREDSAAPAGDPPPLTLDGYASQSGGEPVPGGPVFKAQGELPKAPDTVRVHRPSGEVTAAQVADLAKALKLPGTVSAQGTEWRVGEAGGPGLTVTKQAPGAWTYVTHTPGGEENCPREGGCDSAGSSAPVGLPPVDEAEAKAAAAPVLKALGQDEAKIDASRTMGAVRVVNADPVVAGLPTYGIPAGIEVGPDGEISGASGQLAEPVAGHAYPVIGAKEALKQLNATSSGTAVPGRIGGCSSAVPHQDDLTGGEPQQPCEPGGKPVPPKPRVVVVESAELGLAAYRESGRQVLVPSWLFTVARGPEMVTVTYPAVEKQYLRSPAAPTERPGPTDQPPGSAQPPSPDRPGDGNSGDGNDGADESRSAAVISYSASDRTLTVRFWGGVCSDYSASVRESPERVEVTVTGTPQKPGTYCIMIAKELTATVELEQPLGDRVVVGADGVPIPAE